MNVSGSRASHILLSALCACSLGACASETPAPAVQAAAPAQGGAPKELDEATAKVFDTTELHADTPPHGGAVVELGGHQAHAEVVIVPDTGEVVVHVLDEEGRSGLKIAQPTILADVDTSGRTVRLELDAVADPDAGERPGEASRFSARSDDLLRMAEGTVTLRWVGVKGQVFSDVIVPWPSTTP